jgi:hypothetical protein
MNLRYILFLFCIAGGFAAVAQKVVYSEPDKDDTRRINFEVIGKVGGNFLVYKNFRAKNVITAYDNDMKMVANEGMDYIPEDRLINIDFFPQADYAYLIYQYQKKNIVYCKGVKVDAMGKKISDVLDLDTTQINFVTSNRIYSTVASEDKNSIMVFKINSRNRTKYFLTTLLFNKDLQLRKKTTMTIPMDERNDYLDEFSVDNEGDFVFTKFTRSANDNIGKIELFYKAAMSETLVGSPLKLENIYLDEPVLKIDNVNKRYFLTSFFYKQKRGNIEGFYFYVWDKQNQQVTMQNHLSLGEDIRKEAKGDANVKTAFNDYFIRNVIVRKDGGFLIGTEAYYTSSRFNSWNRWDYLFGSPYGGSLDYYAYSPVYNTWFYRSRTPNAAVRHHADNVTLLSFDNTGKLEWSNVIRKEQYDDESGDYVSYQVMNTGGQLHFVFNLEEKRQQLLNDYTLNGKGEVNRNPTLKNLDKGYEFLPKFAKQVSSRQMIIPCYYRNYICFAKLEYNS